MNTRLTLIAAVLCWVFCAGASGVPMSDAASYIERAEAAFAEGAAMHAEGDRGARSRFAEAAAFYERAIEASGVRNHRLHLNLGNAAMLSGDVGRAVLAYKRADRLAPRSSRVRESLAFARASVGVELRPDARERGRSLLLAWRGLVPRQLLLAGFIGGYALFWIALASGVIWRKPPPVLLGVSAGVAVLSITLLLVERSILHSAEEGVVVSPAGADARLGPGEGVYAPAFDRPLSPGVEVRILESRDGWLRVRLPDGREAWTPGTAVERV
ncbi:MAG: hypothetical protein EA423_08430 [Phycisphaerales bacterium]|nr:MAG: hypothetical protein EA423_08430 [Phycisphaerales bacterium]